MHCQALQNVFLPSRVYSPHRKKNYIRRADAVICSFGLNIPWAVCVGGELDDQVARDRKDHDVTKLGEFIAGRLVAGVLIVTPVYSAILLLFKAAKSVAELLQPLTKLVPEWFPAENILSLLLVLTACFLIGLATQSQAGRVTWERMENSLFQKMPAYSLFRSLCQRVGGKTQDQPWKPALVEIEEALVPSFIIEELDGARFTVFVPSIPTPFAGAIYVLSADRVHPLDIPFTRAIKVVSQWGSGSKDLVAAMEKQKDTVEFHNER
jgi:uncharacterized membrane protein